MITPGFFGIFNAHRGLIAAQNALSTANHNISNANTPGYSRQRVDLTAYTAYTPPTTSQSVVGQIGQGPTVQQITRSRDQFLDTQFRQASGKLGLNTTTEGALSQVEGILAEPSANSINSTMQNFFDAAQEMSLHPDSAAPRANFMQQAVDMVTVFQQQAQQLSELRTNLVGDPLVPSSFATSQLAINVNTVNTKLANIAEINKNIISVKASGAEPNDLLDQRDQLLDELSKIVDVDVTNYDNGQIDLKIGGQFMIKGGKQLDSLQVKANAGPTPLPDDVPSLVSTVTGGVVLNDGSGPEITGGSIRGIINMGGNDPALSTVRGVLGKLDNLISTIATEMNNLQAAGRDQNGNLGTTPIFQNDPTLNPGQPLNIFHWKINPAVINNIKLISAAIDDPTATGGFAGVGDGRNALAMAKLRDQSFPALGTDMVGYLNGTISTLGIDSRSYKDNTTSQKQLVDSVDLRRQSISGVNIDEETIDLLRYQRAFEATSKTISILDQITQSIINMV